MRGRTGAGRNHAAKGGAAAAAVPLPPGSPLHWFDLTDVDQLFTDEAGSTNVASDADAVLRVNNKGSSDEFLSIGAVDAPVYNTAGIPTISTAGVTTFGSTKQLAAAITDVVTHENYTAAIVFSTEVTGPAALVASWDEFDGSFYMAGNDSAVWYTDSEATQTNSTMGTDAFLSYIITHDDEASPTSVMNQSHNLTVKTATHVLVSGPTAGTSLSLGEDSVGEGLDFTGHIAEVIYWNGTLTTDETDLYEAYVTEKYGVVWA